MTVERFNKEIRVCVSRCLEVLAIKEDEYALGGKDRLEHFKSAAALLDTVPKIALMGMLAKQITSLSDMSHNNLQTVSRWKEKIIDSINYLLLLWALVLEEGAVDGAEYI